MTMLSIPAIAKEVGNALDRALTRFQGSMLVLAAGTTFSLGPLTFRALLEADAWQYLFYRSFSAAVVATLTIMLLGRNPIRSIVEAGLWQAVAGLVLGSCFVLFILSLSRATAAFVLLLQCTSPFVAAILGRVFLQERVRRDTVAAMLVASIGVVIMVGGGLDGGDRLGILFSLLLPVSLGGYTVLIRSSPARDPGVPTVIGGFTVAVVAGLVSLVGPGLDLPIRDVAMGCIAGGLLIGLGAPVFNYAHRFVPPSETSLLLIAEVVLAPLWLWAWPGEVPSTSTLVGGGVALSAVAWLTIRAALREGSTRFRWSRGLHAGAVAAEPNHPDR
jgi:drug/metabolite transporter (DMT)-like permease